LDPPKYYRDASAEIILLGTVRETTPDANYRVHFKMHRLGSLLNRLQEQSEKNMVAHMYATFGIVDDSRAICFCRVWTRDDTPVAWTVDTLIGEMLERTQRWVGSRVLLGEVLMFGGVDPAATGLPRSSFHLRVGLDGRAHYPILERQAATWFVRNTLTVA